MSDHLDAHTSTPAAASRAARLRSSLARRGPLVAGALVLVVAASSGGAVAGGLITSKQIKNFTISNRDLATNAVNSRIIADGSVEAQDLSAATLAALRSPAAGAAGAAGTPGSVWLTGEGEPGGLVANDGDWYLDSLTDIVYTRVGGAWGEVVDLTGAQGEKGDKGDQGLKGDQGEKGDQGLKGDQGDKGDKGDQGDKGDKGDQGLKGDQGEKGDQGLKGDQGDKGDQGLKGDRGTVWSSGTGAPSVDDGAVGDWYLAIDTWDAYQKTAADMWTVRVNLRGAKGDKGDTGLKGDKGDKGDAGTNGTNGVDGASWTAGSGAPDAAAGKNGDLYLDTATSDVYRKASGAWTVLTNIKGQKGDPGTNGTNGTDGATWLTGAGAPNAADGKNGDLYLDTTSGDVYKKASGAWGTPVANLTGPAGADGSGGGGTQWLSGAGVPNPMTTNPFDGAFYLNTTNGAIYKANGSTWTAIYTPSATATPRGLVYQRLWTWNYSSIDTANNTYMISPPNNVSSTDQNNAISGGAFSTTGAYGAWGPQKTMLSYARTTGQPSVNSLQYSITLSQVQASGNHTIDGVNYRSDTGTITPISQFAQILRCGAYRDGSLVGARIQSQGGFYTINNYGQANRFTTFTGTLVVPGGIGVGQTLSLRCEVSHANTSAYSISQLTAVNVVGTTADVDASPSNN